MVLRRFRKFAAALLLSGSLGVAGAAESAAAINPMTGEPEETEELRTRLARLQVQSRIENELTSIERSRQERRRLAVPEGRAGIPAMAGAVARSMPKSAPAGRPVPGAPPSVEEVVATPADSPRLVGVFHDGGSGFALTETSAGTRAVIAPLADSSGEGTDRTGPGAGHGVGAGDDAGVRLAPGPGHIELPASRGAESEHVQLPGSPGIPAIPAPSRLGILLPARDGSH
jgi:hypothetical protein